MDGGTYLPPKSDPPRDGFEVDTFSIVAPSGVFPLPGGRIVAAPAWVAPEAPDGAAGDETRAPSSTATRRRYLARRLWRSPMCGAAGGPVEWALPAAPDTP